MKRYVLICEGKELDGLRYTTYENARKMTELYPGLWIEIVEIDL